jgi:hypothetical protein
MSAPHGKKRPAEASLEGEQRLSKRFDLLNLGTYMQFSGTCIRRQCHMQEHLYRLLTNLQTTQTTTAHASTFPCPALPMQQQ